MDKRSLYLDNAATTYPKPPEVAAAVAEYITNVGMNIKRGGYAKAYAAAEALLNLRERLSGFFNGPNPRNLIFTANVTASLNFILKGWLRPGDHVLTTSLEHNAVMRPLLQLQEVGVSFDAIPCDAAGLPDYAAIPRLIRGNTRAIVALHASNVSGAILDIARLGRICREHGCKLIVDSAQSAGILPLDFMAMGIDALAFTGHKGLLGPQGIGGFIISDELAANTTPLIAGGTGSFSHLETMPELLPDRFEAGTPNLPAMAGLSAALDFIESRGIAALREHEQRLARLFIEAMSELPQVRVIGKDLPQRVAVISLDFGELDNAEIAYCLENEHGIMVRCGLHCAPRAHKSLGTFPQGTVRFSPGIYNTEEDMLYAAAAVRQVLAKQ
jgi:cysteine desulfurase family protein